MPDMNTFTIVPTGAYSLRESAEFGFGGRSSDRWDGVMRMAFCLDGYRTQVGVEVRQDDAGVHGVVHGASRAEAELAAELRSRGCCRSITMLAVSSTSAGVTR